MNDSRAVLKKYYLVQKLNKFFTTVCQIFHNQITLLLYIRKAIFLAAFVICLFSIRANADQLQPAVVKEGAFILSENPVIQTYDNEPTHDLVGYLPKGTVVYFKSDEQPKRLFNRNKGSHEFYLLVHSDIGFTGLLRKDLKIDLHKKVLVPVGLRRIPIHTKNSTNDNPIPLSNFSRSEGWLIVLNDQDPDFYDVELPWTEDRDRPPDKGKLWKYFVDDGDVRLISPETVRTEHPFIDILTIDNNQTGDDYLNEIATEIKNIIPEGTLENIHSFLQSLGTLKCLWSLEANAELGLKIIGMGLGMKSVLELKEKNIFITIKKHIYYKGNFVHKIYFTFKQIMCRYNEPYKAVLLVIQESDFDPNKRARLWADDIDDKLKINPSLEGESATERMILVDGYKSFSNAFTFLEEKSAGGEGYIATLPPLDQQVVNSIILSEIAHFRKKPRVGQ